MHRHDTCWSPGESDGCLSPNVYICRFLYKPSTVPLNSSGSLFCSDQYCKPPSGWLLTTHCSFSLLLSIPSIMAHCFRDSYFEPLPLDDPHHFPYSDDGLSHNSAYMLSTPPSTQLHPEQSNPGARFVWDHYVHGPWSSNGNNIRTMGSPTKLDKGPTSCWMEDEASVVEERNTTKYPVIDVDGLETRDTQNKYLLPQTEGLPTEKATQRGQADQPALRRRRTTRNTKWVPLIQISIYEAILV